jgi:NADH-ubiquinone oxidoreductase chain 5
MILPLIILGVGSIFYGFFTRDLIIGLGSLYFNSVFTSFHNFNLIDSEFLLAFIKNIPLIFTIIGSVSSLALINCFFFDKSFIFDQKLKLIPRLFYIFLNKKWHVDQIVNEVIVMKLMNFGYFSSFQAIDKGLIEKVGPSGFTSSVFNFSSNIIGFNSGFIYNAIFIILCSALLFFIFYFCFF